MFDDGKVAVVREVLRLKLCVVDGIPGGAQYAPAGAWELIGEALSPDEIVMRGVVQEKCSPAHLKLVWRALISDMFRYAYAEWIDGQTMPFAEPVREGERAGWWRVDLVRWRLGQRLR